MITFLTNEVYNGNSNNAKSFLDEVYDVAQEIARLIREIDKEALIAWVKEKSKELVNKTRDRFRLN
jgi:prephenate dehydrogenase